MSDRAMNDKVTSQQVRVLRAVLVADQPPRASDLAHACDLSQDTIGRALASLFRAGLLEHDIGRHGGYLWRLSAAGRAVVRAELAAEPQASQAPAAPRAGYAGPVRQYQPPRQCSGFGENNRSYLPVTLPAYPWRWGHERAAGVDDC